MPKKTTHQPKLTAEEPTLDPMAEAERWIFGGRFQNETCATVSTRKTDSCWKASL